MDLALVVTMTKMIAMIETTTFRIEAKLEGSSLNVNIVDVHGNTSDSITKKRIIGVLATAIVAAIRGRQDEDDFDECDLVRFAMNQISEGFADADASYFTPKN